MIRRPSWRRIFACLRFHAAFVVLLFVGIVLRVLVLIAYPAAFFYQDSNEYIDTSHGWRPGPIRQAGYPLLIKVLRHTGSVYSLSVLQPLLVLALATALYALLRRRSVPRWLSVVAVAPLVLDGGELSIEHFVLAETWFTTLTVAGLLALLWPARTTVWSAGLAGLLLAAGASTRTVSLPLVFLTLAYLLVRRVGWRPVAAYSACALAPLAAYVIWFHHFWGQFGFGSMQGAFLYGRTAVMADCSNFPPDLRTICPPQPHAQRQQRSDWYIWSENSPGAHATDHTKLQFAERVILHQPVDFAVAVASDTSKFLLPHRLDPKALAHPQENTEDCTTQSELLPSTPAPTFDWCKPRTGTSFNQRTPTPQTAPRTTWLTRALGWYAHHVQTPHLLLGGSVLLGLVVLLWRPGRGLPVKALPDKAVAEMADGPTSGAPRGRRPQAAIVAGGREAADVILMGGWGLGLLVLCVAGSMYDLRYGLPSLFLLPVAGAWAVWRITRLARGGSRPQNGPAGLPLQADRGAGAAPVDGVAAPTT